LNAQETSLPGTLLVGEIDWFACDNTASSPCYGNCCDAFLDYSAGTSFVNALVVSKDGGRTWSAPVSLKHHL
jgi:hypothetical protein